MDSCACNQFRFIDLVFCWGSLYFTSKKESNETLNDRFRFSFMAHSTIGGGKKGSLRTHNADSNALNGWFSIVMTADGRLSFFRSILIQFESNCKSIILVTMICFRFYDIRNQRQQLSEANFESMTSQTRREVLLFFSFCRLHFYDHCFE